MVFSCRLVDLLYIYQLSCVFSACLLLYSALTARIWLASSRLSADLQLVTLCFLINTPATFLLVSWLAGDKGSFFGLERLLRIVPMTLLEDCEEFLLLA